MVMKSKSHIQLAVIIIVLLGVVIALNPTSLSAPEGGIKTCFKNPDGTVSCEIAPQLAIVNSQGRIYASFSPFLKISSNIGTYALTVNYKIDVTGNGTSKTIQSETLQSSTPFSKEITINADNVESAMDSLSLKKGSLVFSYIYNIKETGEVRSGSSSIRDMQKLIIQADTGISGGTTSSTTSSTSPSTTDFQKTECIIPYYYYSSAGLIRPCASITSITVQADKTVRVPTFIPVSCSPSTYGCAGGDIQMGVIDSSGNLITAGQCLNNFCYIAGSKDYPQFAAPSGVGVGENRHYSQSSSDTLIPRRLGGSSELIIFDKGTYSILLVDGGVQVAKKTFTVG